MQKITTSKLYVWSIKTDRQEPFYGGLEVQLEQLILDIAKQFEKDPSDIAYDVYFNLIHKEHV